MDSKYVHNHVFWMETDEEKERPLDWRYWRLLPAAGTVGVFFGGWYGDAIRKFCTGHMSELEFNSHMHHYRGMESSLAASGMAICNVRLKRYPVTLRYQIDIPLLGMAFAPDYRQSYYEIFALGNTEGILHFTSLYNRPSTRQVLSVDLPVRNAKLRIAYLCDLEQSTAGGLRFHRYSHTLMAGFVRTFYRIRGKRPKAVPVYQTYNGKRL